MPPPTCSRAGSRQDRVRVNSLPRDRSRTEHERTAADRQRDREERERRRAERGGTAVPPASSPGEEPHALEAPPALGDVHEADEPDEAETARFEDIRGAEDPNILEAERVEDLARAADSPPAELTHAAEEMPPAAEEMPPAAAAPHAEESAPAVEAPQAAEELPSVRPAAPAPPRATAASGTAPRTLAPPRRRPHVRRRSPPARVAAVLALAAAVAVVFFLLRSLTGSKGTPSTVVPKVVTVLIPEGKTRAQIAEIAAARHLKGSYTVASRRSPALDPVHYGAPHGTPDLEGFLFPATYELNPGDPASRLVGSQLTAFREHFGASEVARARDLHVTPYQLLTIASMVEREAQTASDRPKIAAVIYNRLGQGMPLGIDATIYYAVELQKGVATYTHELTEAQLHIDSPYNTRTHTGLPPTPISNPGVASIQAAAHPAHAGYLYYVAGADGCGEQIFSTTQAGFEKHVADYKAAVEKNHGHPPACKKK